MHVSPTCPKRFPKAVWSFPGNSQGKNFQPFHQDPCGTQCDTAQFLLCSPSLCTVAREDEPSMAPSARAAQPSTPSPPASSPQTTPRPSSQGRMSRLLWLCFAREWKETAARGTGSLYPLIFSQQSVSDSHPNLEGQEYYSEKSFMAIA